MTPSQIGKAMAKLRNPANMARTPEQARKAALIGWAKRKATQTPTKAKKSS